MDGLKVYPPGKAFERIRKAENLKRIRVLQDLLKRGDRKLYMTAIREVMTSHRENEFGKN
jgi:hypothetical protein